MYVAALGHAFGRNQQRGVFRSTDGGEHWEQVLFVSDKAGAVDLSIDVNNPRIIYASIWECYRNFHMMSSGGEDSGIWRSLDGGDSWENISSNKGLPAGILGKSRHCGVASAIRACLCPGRARRRRHVPLGRLWRQLGLCRAQ